MKSLKKLKNIQYFLLLAGFSLIFSALVALPIEIEPEQNSLFTNSVDSGFFAVVAEFLLVAIAHYFLNLFLLSLRRFGLILWVVQCFFSLLTAYYFISFGKNIDSSVISDIIENLNDLTFEYLNLKSLLLILVITFILGYLAYLLQKKKMPCSRKTFLIFNSSILLLFIVLSSGDILFLKKIFRNYPPFSIVNSLFRYVEITWEMEVKIKKSQSLNLISQHKVSYKANKKPRVIVFVIGESLRNDYFYQLLPKFAPKLKNDPNILFFDDVHSCETSTNKSLPCLLTDVDNDNWSDFFNSVNLIDLFKAANFYSYWIDAQSLDSTYSLIVGSSDFVIERRAIDYDLHKKNNLDEDLLPYLQRAIDEKNERTKDKFILLHTLGSHWHLDMRYPKDYALFSPHCTVEKDLGFCSREEISNSYKNSVVYSLAVLEKIIDQLKDKNALVVFTPDHGFSLGEEGRFGNSASNNPFEQISVPLFIWYSAEFKKENSPLIKNLQRNSQQKITHSNVFHSIAGCSGIESDLIRKDLNLCAKK